MCVNCQNNNCNGCNNAGIQINVECNDCTPTPCVSPNPCSEIVPTTCIQYVGNEKTCGTDVVYSQGDTIGQIEEKIVDYFCQKISDVSAEQWTPTSIDNTIEITDNGTTYDFSANLYTEVTYAEITTLINTNSLVPGSFYLITDFQTIYDQPDFTRFFNDLLDGYIYLPKPSNQIQAKTGTITPIFVTATSVNTLAPDAYQPAYPNDKLKYDVSWNQTEVTNTPAKGRITERIDELNNRTDYDHREVLFKRYNDGFGNYTAFWDTGNLSQEFTTFAWVLEGTPYSNNNYIGNYADISILYGDAFILSNNVFGINTEGNNTDVYFVNNTFGNYAYYNKIGDYSFNNVLGEQFQDNDIKGWFQNNIIGNFAVSNTIGQYCNNNTIDTGFKGNIIGNSFNNNFIGTDFGKYPEGFLFLSEELPGNVIANNFENNFIGSYFSANHIGSFFQNNIGIGNEFINNTIGNQFKDNTTGEKFSSNKIGNKFQSNVIGTNFGESGEFIPTYANGNIIGDLFIDNQIADFCFGNNIANNFENNAIGTFFVYNTIGEGFYFNGIGTGFGSNKIGRDFSQNTIGDNFGINDIGFSFYNNIIGNDFQKNHILNNFESNTIGNTFISNSIANYFSSNNTGINFGGASAFNPNGNNIADNFKSNTVVANFRLNETKSAVLTQNFTTATHVYGNYYTTMYKRPDGTLRLKYYNDSDALIIVAVTA